MKIIYNNIIPFKGYLAINLFGVLFARKDASRKLNEIDINHEAIHSALMAELLWIPFYIWYGIEWLINLFKYRSSHEAYRNIRFEKEAYNHERDLDYLKTRKPYKYS